EAERAEAFAPVVAERLAEDRPPPVDVVMVHDQRMAADLGGEVPLVLAGHTHEPDVGVIEPPDEDEDEPEDGSEEGTTAADEPGGEGEERTLLLVEGSTGGAGLRGLQGEEPEPLTATVLYFDREEGRLVAYDRITVAWLEDAGATIERHIVDEDDPGGPGDGPGGGEAAPPVARPASATSTSATAGPATVAPRAVSWCKLTARPTTTASADSAPAVTIMSGTRRTSRLAVAGGPMSRPKTSRVPMARNEAT